MTAASILDAIVQAQREEREDYAISIVEGEWTVLTRLARKFYKPFPSEAACRAWIDRRAVLAGIKALAASEPTEAMHEAWIDAKPASAEGELTAMLLALVEEIGEP